MGKSIFDLTDKTGFQSRWEEDWVEKENNGTHLSESSKAASGSTKVVLLTEERVFAIKTDILLRFKFYGPESWYNTPDSTVSLTSSDSNVDIKSPAKWTVENGWGFLAEISKEKPAKVKLYIDIDGTRKHTFDVEFKKSFDVFTLSEIDRLTDEYTYIAKFNNLDDPPSEYDTNYCMQGADRALGKLLNNSSDFYVVEHGTHKVKNSIDFNAGTGNTYQRATTLNSKGLIKSSYAIDSKYWNVDYNMRDKINSKYPPYKNAQDYARSIMFDIAWVTKSHGNNFYLWLKKKCDEVEPGYHVYYLSIVDGFHTQVLIVNNADRNNPRYEIWDDHGITSSKGKLDDITNGIDRQTSSMFATSCLFRLPKGTSDGWDKQTLKVWKIKKK